MATAIHKLHGDFLSCNICTDLYQDPCTLACGHTFCRSCLTTFTKTQSDAIKVTSFLCPNCRQMTKVPNPGRSVDDWVKQIKPSFLIVGLLDSFAVQSEMDKVSENLCFSCKQSNENIPASSHCIDCDIGICTRCTKGHKAMPGTSHHVFNDLDEAAKVRRKRKAMCKAHNCILEFCCQDCQKAICHKCCILDHRKCDNIVTIESMMPKMKSVLKTKKKMMVGEVKKMKSAFTRKENKIKEITAQRANIQSEMSIVTQKAISLIRQEHKLLEDELAMLTEKQIDCLMRQMKSEEIDIQTYRQHSEFIDQVLAAESKMDMYDMYQMCQSGAITTVSNTDTELQKGTGRIVFVEEQMLRSNFNLGRFNVLEENFDPECKPTLVDTIDIRMKSDKVTPDPLDVVVVDVNGIETLVVTDYGNKCLKSIYHRYKKPRQQSLSLRGAPWSLISLIDNQVAVSFNSRNEILIVQVNPNLTIMSTIATQKIYIGLSSLNGSTLVASCRDPPSLDILDCRGHVQKSVKLEGKLIDWPSFLSTTSNGYILVSDEGVKSICCLTVEGTIIFTYRPSGDRTLSLPRGIATSNTGDILVADSDRKKVIQLTASGEFVRDLLTSRDKCVKPYGICLYKHKLYVAMEEGTVNVYRC